MKRAWIFSLILVFILSGCAEHPVAPAAGDFTLTPPDGYVIDNITDLNCTLVQQEDASVVGGMEVTAMSLKALMPKALCTTCRMIFTKQTM